jgi:hypothetical protein
MQRKRLGVNRRQFFTHSALAAGATTLGGGLFDALIARAHAAGRNESDNRRGVGYGPLRPAGDDLALPEGFQYRVVRTEGDAQRRWRFGVPGDRGRSEAHRAVVGHGST